jgi:hypothetical protein
MSNAIAVKPGGRRRGKELLHFLLEVGKRVYAVGVIVLTSWLSFLALRYLIVTLMFPSAAPPQIVGIPTRLDRSLLQTRRSEWLGVAVSENPRTPPAHYHRIDGWIQPDGFNDCTRAGCHTSLPHSKRKEVRAFLNMHATSLHCGVCHIRTDDRPLALTWYDLSRGKPRGAPSALLAYGFLTSDEGRKRLAQPTAADQTRLADLLAAAAREADGLPALEELARHVAAVRPTSEAFQRLMDAARETLPRHFRGEYGAKLALRTPDSRRPILGHPATADAVRDYLRSGASLSNVERDRLLAKVHPLKREQPLHCMDCHRAEGSLVDLAGVGYPAARREALVRPAVFQMIQHISDGQPMHLLQLPGPEQPPAHQAATQPGTP